MQFESQYEQCNNCGSYEYYLDFDTSKVCNGCGMVNNELGFNTEISYNSLGVNQHFSMKEYLYNPFKYFERKIRCLQGLQNCKNKELITELRILGAYTLEDIKQYLYNKKLYRKYIDIPSLYLSVHKLNPHDDKQNDFLMDELLVVDLKFLYRRYLIYVYEHLPNKTKRLPSVDTTCYQLLIGLETEAKNRKIYLPYDTEEIKKLFKIVQTKNTFIKNMKSIGVALSKMDFDNILHKYNNEFYKY